MICRDSDLPPADYYWSAWLLLNGVDPSLVRPDDIAGQLATIQHQEEPENLVTALARASSIPTAATQELYRQFGESTLALFLALNQRAPIGVRVNPRISSREQVLAQLQRDGIDAHPSSFADHGIIIRKRANLQGHRLFQQGAFEIQDEASQLVAKAIPTNGHTLIDFCAGAGGKTLHLDATLPKQVSITSCDVRASALKELKRRLKRARSKRRVTTLLLSGDGQRPTLSQPTVCWLMHLAQVLEFFEGTHNRHNMTPKALERTRALQNDILRITAELVKPSGHLIYATCSILPSENEECIKAFLSAQPSFQLEPIENWWPDGAETFGSNGYLRADPLTHGTDGFFVARLRRKAND